ncbi:8-oxo-dGTP pyrophosphatase MutT (NUDIX family) [Actinomycetospora cinnamomea]|uniref:8-oxo-dGTP pyrophosphatase MutT (NUDIX family) n=2 Tax=Actinomycetospora cinnamomea TaxID=663609 RepID=A0A2U1FRC4_9PSEU|nr:8-oxo-dGTP pyrophosphatase MutT (NUDIX family) [Actinomycetospora cinnamomea]
MEPPLTTSTREVYANPWMSLREDTFRRPDGGEGLYGVVDKPDYALVIPLDGDRLGLVEQYRYPIGLRRWEFPQGTAPDRAALPADQLAARELQEETGLRAGTWTYLGLLDVAPGLSSQRGRAFLATDLTAGAPAREDTEADMRFAWLTRDEFEHRARCGEITDAQSLAAYALLMLRAS